MPTKEEVIDNIKTIFDPEIPVNIYDLGLIYEIGVEGEAVNINMTLTSQHCPAAQSLPENVRQKIAQITGVSSVNVNVVWEPPWTQEKI